MTTRGGSKRKISKRFDLRREVGVRVGANSKYQISKRGVKFVLCFGAAFRRAEFYRCAGYVKFYFVSATCLKALNFKLLAARGILSARFYLGAVATLKFAL